MDRDPVCGMMVEPANAAASYEYKGKTYYFCAAGCKASFERSPEQFLGHERSEHSHHTHH